MKLFLACCVFSIAAIFMLVDFTNYRAIAAAAKDPVELATLAVGSTEADVKARLSGSNLTVEYLLDPFALTRSSTKSAFYLHTKRIVSGVFDRFPEVMTIMIVGNSTFTDIRGNKNVDRAFVVKFSRANAATVKWDNVQIDNIPLIADYRWSAPAFAQ